MSCVVKAKNNKKIKTNKQNKIKQNKNKPYLLWTGWQHFTKPFCCHFILWGSSGHSFHYLCTFPVWLLACFMSSCGKDTVLWFKVPHRSWHLLTWIHPFLYWDLRGLGQGSMPSPSLFYYCFLSGWKSCHIEMTDWKWVVPWHPALDSVVQSPPVSSSQIFSDSQKETSSLLSSCSLRSLPPQPLANIACFNIYVFGGSQHTSPE